MTPFLVKRGKVRYWASRYPDGWKFWSSHKWPFYHGHIRTNDRNEAIRAFREWLPFKLNRPTPER